MKKHFTMKWILTMLLMAGMVSAQENNYDEKLAKSLGADEYGMRQYVLVILKTGDAILPDAEKKEAMAGHMANIGKMAEDGTLAVAGPFFKNDLNYRGLYLFSVKTVEEAKALTETDPAVKAGIFKAEYLPWYGSAALPETNKLHSKIAKTKI